MQFKGKAHKVGAHIDTDAIIPARFLVTTDPDELGANCMEGLEPGWIERIEQGDIIVAEENFGCGSSREHAPIAIKGSGIPVVVAHSFARIFYRNAFNMGLILMEVGEQIGLIENGHELEVDVHKGVITNVTTGAQITSQPVPESMLELLEKGGLVPYVKSRLEEQA